MLSIRHWLFVGLMSLLLGIVWTLVWFELVLQMHLSTTYQSFCFSFFVTTYVIQIVHLISMQSKNPSPAFVFTAYFFMGLFIHLFCGMLTKDLLVFVPAIALHEELLTYAVVGLAVLLNAWGIYTALRGPQVKHVSIPLSQNHQVLRGLKIVQISDLHAGPLLGKNYIEKVVRTANELDADFIALTGDIGDSDPEIFGNLLTSFKSLQSRQGVFYITGNHEYYWGAEKWIEIMRSCGAKPLLNEGVSLCNGALWLGGVTDPDGPHFIPSHTPDALKAIGEGRAGNAYKILLAHQPKNCFAAEKAGFDLMLAGHTHGGQFFPFNLLVGLFNPYHKELNRHHHMHVYVNQGTGFWGPALRLGVPAEITLLEFNIS